MVVGGLQSWALQAAYSGPHITHRAVCITQTAGPGLSSCLSWPLRFYMWHQIPRGHVNQSIQLGVSVNKQILKSDPWFSYFAHHWWFFSSCLTYPLLSWTIKTYLNSTTFQNEKINEENVHWSPVHQAFKTATHFLTSRVTSSSCYPARHFSHVPTHHFKGKLFSWQFPHALKSHFLLRNSRWWKHFIGLSWVFFSKHQGLNENNTTLLQYTSSSYRNYWKWIWA